MRRTTRHACPPVIVLGMHRSGTSIAAALIKRLGVSMGRRMIGRMMSNPAGHFEDIEFLRLNVDILHAAGGSWREPPSEERILQAASAFEDRIRDMVAARDGRMWGWKDPRTILTFAAILPHVVAPRLLVCRRDAGDAATSLARRNRMSPEDAVALGDVYIARLEELLREHVDLPRCELQYEAILREPEEAVLTIAGFIGIDVSARRARRIARFVFTDDRRGRLQRRTQRMLAAIRVFPWRVARRLRHRSDGSAGGRSDAATTQKH